MGRRSLNADIRASRPASKAIAREGPKRVGAGSLRLVGRALRPNVRFLNDFVVLHARIEIEQRGCRGRFDDRLRDVAPGEASDRFDRLPSRQDQKLDPILELTAAQMRAQKSRDLKQFGQDARAKVLGVGLSTRRRRPAAPFAYDHFRTSRSSERLSLVGGERTPRPINKVPVRASMARRTAGSRRRSPSLARTTA